MCLCAQPLRAAATCSSAPLQMPAEEALRDMLVVGGVKRESPANERALTRSEEPSDAGGHTQLLASDEFIRDLIDAVKAEPVLYQPSHRHFRCVQARV